MTTQVRLATADDVAAITELTTQIQAALTASGSLQQFGPVPLESVERRVANGAAWVLDIDGVVSGGVFVEPKDRMTLPDAVAWGIDDSRPFWYLSKLMIAPTLQRGGLGNLLLQAAQRMVAETPGGLLILDCWAGNDKLRHFYTQAGFSLQGVFSDRDGDEEWEIAVFTWRAPG